MLGFMHHQKRRAVQRLLTSRVNHQTISNINPGERNSSRAPFCEVLWVMPNAKGSRADVSIAFPVVGKDVSARGMSLVHTAPIDCDDVLVGIQTDTGPSFVHCRVEHTTALGYGFHQIGLLPMEVVKMSNSQITKLQKRLTEFDAPRSQEAPATV